MQGGKEGGRRRCEARLAVCHCFVVVSRRSNPSGRQSERRRARCAHAVLRVRFCGAACRVRGAAVIIFLLLAAVVDGRANSGRSWPIGGPWPLVRLTSTALWRRTAGAVAAATLSLHRGRQWTGCVVERFELSLFLLLLLLLLLLLVLVLVFPVPCCVP